MRLPSAETLDDGGVNICSDVTGDARMRFCTTSSSLSGVGCRVLLLREDGGSERLLSLGADTGRRLMRVGAERDLCEGKNEREKGGIIRVCA